jgi:hypothetical protein
MTRAMALAAIAAICAGAATAYLPRALDGAGRAATAEPRPAWTETQWPFARDPWGAGRAFRCAKEECGAEVMLFLRAKLGFCNCVTGIADDDELDRMGDLALVGEASPMGGGRPVAVGWMKGRARAYSLGRGGAALSIAFNDRCDMAVATVVLPHGRAEAIEPAVLDFLNGATVLDWTKRAFGI